MDACSLPLFRHNRHNREKNDAVISPQCASLNELSSFPSFHQAPDLHYTLDLSIRYSIQSLVGWLLITAHLYTEALDFSFLNVPVKFAQ